MDSAPFHADLAGGPPGGRAVWLHASDGVRLRAALWPGAGRGTVLLLPGRTEVAEKYGAIAADLVAAGWGVVTLDWRGQGLSDRVGGDSGLGHVRRFAEYQADVAALRALACGLARPHVMLSHSMGGCIGLRALIDGLPVAAAAFSAPMWGLPLTRTVRLGIAGLALAGRLRGRDGRAVPGERSDFALSDADFDANMLTTDRAQFDRMQAQVRARPELALGAPTLAWLSAALAETSALARLPSPACPAMTGVGSLEKIVCPRAIADRMERWPGGRLTVYPGAEHELMMEAPATRRAFLDAALALFDRAAS